jgi:peptidyl-dipeptidase Dcp
MTRIRLIIAAASGVALAGCATTSQQPATTTVATNGHANGFSPANPFYAESTLPWHAPPFDRIKDTDYQPAFEAGMREQIAEIEAIANQSAAPSFENTFIPMEKSGAVLYRVSKVFNAITGANTNDVLQKIQEEEAPKLAAHSDAIFLNDKLFRRVKAIYDARETSNFNAEQKRLVEYTYNNFVRAGALLSEADKTKLRALNQEEAKLSTDFQNKLLAATKNGALVLDSRDQLAGMSENEIAAAADAAKQRGLTGKWVIPLQNTTQHPAQASLSNRAIRERLFKASTMRTEHGDTTDTRATIQRLAQLRADKAKLLGYPTYSAYALDNQMAKAPAEALKLLNQLVPAATAKARSEAAQMQA